LVGKANQTRISAFALLRTFIVDELRLSREDARIIIGRWASEIQQEEAEENAYEEVGQGWDAEGSAFVAPAPAPEPEVSPFDALVASTIHAFATGDTEAIAVFKGIRDRMVESLNAPAPDPEPEDVEVRCVCERCGGEGWCFVSESRAKELKDMDMMESACPFPNCSADAPEPEDNN
jgi:hypothetical protein